MLRDQIKYASRFSAMKAGDKDRTAALRLIMRQDQGPRHRTAHRREEVPDDDALVIEVLQKMAKQRRESIAMYEDGGRQELADQEQPRTCRDRGIPAAADERGGNKRRDRGDQGRTRRGSIKDMGRVMAELKSRHGAELDMSKASALVKESFCMINRVGPLPSHRRLASRCVLDGANDNDGDYRSHDALCRYRTVNVAGAWLQR